MKNTIAICMLLLLVLTGCWYDEPLTEEHNIPIDPSVLGMWEIASDEEGDDVSKEGMLILKFSDTEYMIHYIADRDGFYYRGYPVNIGGVACVQLEVIGTTDGIVDNDMKSFYVASYQLTDGDMVIKLLNTDLVDKDLAGCDALRKAFLKHKDNPELFHDPGHFRRPQEKNTE